ncbi:MAG: RNA pseudouridine synthase [Verrucomicrobia bacterium]|nr:RNA pseudouridine synthase [Verrucomicrobiota bacterium]
MSAALDILAEGPAWLVVAKPPFELAHPTKPGGPRTLLCRLGEALAVEVACGRPPALVHRLDRETSGAVLVALGHDAASHFGWAMTRHEIAKEYLAIVRGAPAWERQEVDAPILRAGSVGDSPVWLRQVVHPRGAAARTDFEVRARFRRDGHDFTLLAARPHTGRMHQIRVHAALLGHPLVGDKLYHTDGSHYLRFIGEGWTPALAAELLLPRHALHAAALAFVPPEGGPPRRVEAPLAADLQSFLPAHPAASSAT